MQMQTYSQASRDFQSSCHHGSILLLPEGLFGTFQQVICQQSQDNGDNNEEKDKDGSASENRTTSSGSRIAGLGGLIRDARRPTGQTNAAAVRRLASLVLGLLAGLPGTLGDGHRGGGWWVVFSKQRHDEECFLLSMLNGRKKYKSHWRIISEGFSERSFFFLCADRFET